VGEAFRQQDFRGGQADQLGAQAVHGYDLGGEAAAGQGQPGQGQHFPAFIPGGRGQGQHGGVGLVVQQGLVGEGAGGDDAHHLAFHRPLAGLRVADLLADGHRLPQFRQPRQILFRRVVGHAGHADGLAGGGAPGGEGDVQQAGGLLGVVMEQLVEVAHAVEQQHVGVIRLDAQVLLHHGGVLGEIG
jgi:hypothetical protein